jgi:hypothetical protein
MQQITPTLIDSYIVCISNPASITQAPFKLLLSIMNRSPQIYQQVNEIIDRTIPSIVQWNTHSNKSERV